MIINKFIHFHFNILLDIEYVIYYHYTSSIHNETIFKVKYPIIYFMIDMTYLYHDFSYKHNYCNHYDYLIDINRWINYYVVPLNPCM